MFYHIGLHYYTKCDLITKMLFKKMRETKSWNLFQTYEDVPITRNRYNIGSFFAVPRERRIQFQL